MKDVRLHMSVKSFLANECSQTIGSLLQGDFHKLKEYQREHGMRLSQAIISLVSYEGSYSALYNCEDDSKVLNEIAEQLWN